MIIIIMIVMMMIEDKDTRGACKSKVEMLFSYVRPVNQLGFSDMYV